jgi:hypothetical protein
MIGRDYAWNALYEVLCDEVTTSLLITAFNCGCYISLVVVFVICELNSGTAATLTQPGFPIHSSLLNPAVIPPL